MREKARDRGRLEDILEYSARVIKYMDGLSLEMFVADERTYYAVMKNVEVVGEAAYMLTKDYKSAHPDTPWKKIEGMRHVLVHDYANISIKDLYRAAVNDIPVLCEQVQNYLSQTDWDEWEA